MSSELNEKWSSELNELRKKTKPNKMEVLRINELEKKLSKVTTTPNQNASVFSQKQIIGFEIENLLLNPRQPRKYFSEQAISDLAQSIKTYGQLEPVIVADIAGKFYLVSGERRVRATQILGQTKVDGVINDSIRTLDDLYLYAIAENADRENLNCGEIALIVKNLRDESKMTFDKIGQLLSMSKTATYRYNQIASLDNSLLDLVIEKNIDKPNVLEKIAQLNDQSLQEKYILLLAENKIAINDIKEDNEPKITTKTQTQKTYKNIEEGVKYFKDKLTLLQDGFESMSKKELSDLLNELSKEIKLIKNIKK